MILLTNNDYATADLPNNEDALTIIKGEIPVTESTANPPIPRLTTNT